ncbi:hypothetical protein BVC80_4511g1 [Macleaya cordata]|uniref:Uncharacterized protein n=1 Tax=Macleaya cordata TaxID=56857 RepID=A0A200QE69_MACCD|nr:hypothetical protein BVC80_4511g1 [Macleaya cordata]
MSGTGSDDLLRFHIVDRHLFIRLVRFMGKDAALTKMVIALWLLLEELGYKDLIRTIFSKDNSTLDAIFQEATSCLNCMDPNTGVQPTDFNDTPLLYLLLNEPINRRYFYYNRDFLLNGLNHILNSICSVIFDENSLKAVEDPAMNLSVLGAFGEGTSAQGALLGSTSSHSSTTGPVVTTDQTLSTGASPSLNPSANPFVVAESTPKDQRSMFLTFSNGFPLRREEIFQFFTANWGPIVEEVMIERTTRGVAPQFGRVVFNNASIIPRILNNQPTAKFFVNGKDLWARMYSPRKRN